MWPDRRFIDLVGVELPIIQAPMAGASGTELAIEVCRAGGLGSLPCAMLDSQQMRDSLAAVQQATERPCNVNFFCHQSVVARESDQVAWQARLTHPAAHRLMKQPANSSNRCGLKW